MTVPYRILNLPATRTYATVSNSFLGQHAIAYFVGASSLGGYYTSPIRLPVDFDHTRDSHVYIELGSSAAGTPGTAVTLQAASTRITQAPSLITNTTYSFDWPVPGLWPTSNPQRVELLDGLGQPLFPAHSLTPGDLLGLRVTRNGPSATDTWNQGVNFAANVEFYYPQLCQFADCL
jgi:hypothetical protein